MPISVLCPGCKARFSVNEKFAGKKGPCPKCKAIIMIPTEVVEEIKIHAPEAFASGGKDSKGRLLTKPIAREKLKINPTAIAMVAAIAILVIFGAFFTRSIHDPMLKGIIAGVGLALISPPLVIAGYTFMRNDEMEPYRGRSLWIRASICGVAYAALWGVYAGLASYELLSGEPYFWLFVGPMFIGLGGGAAAATLDLDFGSAAFHYCFYLAVTMALHWAMGFQAIWSSITAV